MPSTKRRRKCLEFIEILNTRNNSEVVAEIKVFSGKQPVVVEGLLEKTERAGMRISTACY